MRKNKSDLNKVIEIAIIFLQMCDACGFCFFVESSEAEYYSCPCCLHAVNYSEDWSYAVEV